jgi:hypothetical protein
MAPRKPVGTVVKCQTPGCHHPKYARGWCKGHYKRWRDGGNTDTPLRPSDVHDVCATRVVRDTRRKLSRFLQETGLTEYEAVRRILDTWAAQQPPLPDASEGEADTNGGGKTTGPTD